MTNRSISERSGHSGEVFLTHPTGTKIMHLLGIACCLVLVIGPIVATGQLLFFPVMQIGALLIALAGLSVAPGLLRTAVLRLDKTGVELSHPHLTATWDEIAVAGVVVVRPPKRAVVLGSPRVNARLELVAADSVGFRQAHPAVGRLSSRRQPSTYRISLRDRADLATAVDRALIKAAPNGVYQNSTDR